jgi:TetR/AcrR family transcriptional regulator
MSLRAEQRNRSRQTIVDAAVEVFATHGYQRGTTRDVAFRANTTQGLVTYHFPTKDLLWQAAIDQLFLSFRTLGIERLKLASANTAEDIARQLIREYVRIAAGHANLFRIIVTAGDANDARNVWAVNTHIRPLYDVFAEFCAAVDVRPENIGSAFFIVVGGASLVFAVPGHYQHLTGIDPTTEAEIDRHADFLARVLIPETNT